MQGGRRARRRGGEGGEGKRGEEGGKVEEGGRGEEGEEGGGEDRLPWADPDVHLAVSPTTLSSSSSSRYSTREFTCTQNTSN